MMYYYRLGCLAVYKAVIITGTGNSCITTYDRGTWSILLCIMAAFNFDT